MLHFIYCYAECRYAKSVIMLNVVMLSDVMLNVIILNVIMPKVVMLNVIMLNVVMLSVVALQKGQVHFISEKNNGFCFKKGGRSFREGIDICGLNSGKRRYHI
jgi:hypothetical protein